MSWRPLRAWDPEKIVLVLGHQADKVRSAVSEFSLEIVLQAEQLGTGHAVQQAMGAISGGTGPVLILCADTPLVTTRTLKDLIELHQKSRSAITFITTTLDDPFGYGRVVRGRTGVMRVVEEKDATAAQRKIREVNAGIYCFERKFLLSSLARLGKSNAQGEYYLPDTIALAKKKKHRVSAFVCGDPMRSWASTRGYDLSRAEAVVQRPDQPEVDARGRHHARPGTVFIGSEVASGP